MNEETILDNRTMVGNTKNVSAGTSKAQAWKYVTLGGVPGILMGAGLMHADSIFAAEPEEVSDEEKPQEEAAVTDTESPQVASAHDDLSFGAAFDAARAEVGPGGVFEWHGGLYNTYTADEWNAMTDEQKNDFAEQVRPITPVEHIQTPTDAHTHVVVVHDMQPAQEHPTHGDVHEAVAQDDVRIVSTGEYQGHAVVGLDLNGDNQPDVAVIDVDDNLELSDADVVVTRDGDVAMVGDIADPDDGDVSVVSEEVSVEPYQDDDVHVVGHAEYEGYDVYAVDLTGNDQADVAVIDVDGTGNLSDPDVIIDGDGNYATIEDIMNATDPNADYSQTDNIDSSDYSDGMDYDMVQSV